MSNHSEEVIQQSSLREFVEREWLPTVERRLAPSTHESYELYLARHVLPALGEVGLSDLTPSALNDLYAMLLDSGRLNANGGLGHRTVRYIHTIVHTVLRDAVRWGHLQDNVSDRADPPSLSASRSPEMRTWDSQTLATFLARSADAGDPLHPAWVLLATTGLRRGEALGVRSTDLDLDRRTLLVHQQVNVVRHQVVITPRTKSGRPRVLDLDRHTTAVLRSLPADDARNRHGLVFTRPSGEPLHPGRFTRAFHTRLTRWQLPRIRLHDLRHTWATLALEAGIDIKIVSDRLGHANPSITWATYQHVTPRMRTDAADRVAALIFGAHPPE